MGKPWKITCKVASLHVKSAVMITTTSSKPRVASNFLGDNLLSTFVASGSRLGCCNLALDYIDQGKRPVVTTSPLIAIAAHYRRPPKKN